MARILSSPWSIIRGSIAGTTYFANQFHQIVARARTAPVQPGTNYQAMVKSAFDAASSLWETLTDDQRHAWDTYSGTCSWTGPLGSYTIPGRQMFVAVHGMKLYLMARGVVFNNNILTAPLRTGFLNVDNVQATSGSGASTTGITVSFGNPNAETILGWAERSLGFDLSRYRYKGPWDSAALLSAQALTLTTGSLLYTALTPDLRYFARFRAISKQGPFRISAKFFVNAIATTTPDSLPRRR